jgi:CheY-like chemotaxis protein
MLPRVSRGRVLVVDDDPAIREVVADILEMENYVVDLAKDGRAALERLREHRPDVVLLDLMMPVMDGWQFLEAEDCDGLAIIVMSAAANAATLRGNPNVRGFLPKPFDLIELLRAVGRAAGSS